MQKQIMLKKTDEFSSVFSFRKRYSSQHIVVHYKPNQIKQLKVGFVVAKKVAKRAVDRNYMRRVLREFCRHHLVKAFDTDQQGLHAVIQIRKKFDKKDFLSVNEELALVFDRIKHKL